MAYPEFPNHDDFTAISKVLAGECEGEITVRGWIYRTRSSGKLAFIVIRDSTGSIQSTVSKKMFQSLHLVMLVKHLLNLQLL